VVRAPRGVEGQPFHAIEAHLSHPIDAQFFHPIDDFFAIEAQFFHSIDDLLDGLHLGGCVLSVIVVVAVCGSLLDVKVE